MSYPQSISVKKPVAEKVIIIQARFVLVWIVGLEFKGLN